MRIYELGHAIMQKFVPMDVNSMNELQMEAAKSYKLLVSEAQLRIDSNQKSIEWNASNPNEEQKPLLPLTVKHKIAGFLESPWCRYVIAALYVFLVPKIRSIINGTTDEGGEQDDDMSAFEEYKEFMRFKRSMI